MVRDLKDVLPPPDVKFDNPGEVAEIILAANYLLRLVERLSSSIDDEGNS